MEDEDAPTDWYAGMTQKHYDIALSKVRAAEREPCIVVRRALVLAAFLPENGGRTFGELRAAATTLFGEAQVQKATLGTDARASAWHWMGGAPVHVMVLHNVAVERREASA